MSIRRLIYTLLIYCLVPFVVLRLLIRSRKNAAFRQRIGERFGFVHALSDKPVIWFHVVSVGETLGAKPLILKLVEQHPDHHILVSSTTLTGSDTVQKLFGDQVKHVYFPYDLQGSLKRFLNHIQPKKLIIMETEIWPNLYASCQQRNIPIIIVNARLSQRSMKSYLKIKTLVAETLVHVCLIAARGEDDVKHFKQLGASDQQLEAVGNIKFDLEISTQETQLGQCFRQQWGHERLVWVAASTHQGEDAQVLAMHQNLLKVLPSLLLVIVPRHPERFDDVYQLAKQTGLSIQRRSEHKEFSPEAQIITGDSMGEMLSWFAAADIAFMGGSLVETGGHNPLEPAALAVPVVSGPHVFNFAEIFPLLEDKNAAWVLGGVDAIQKKLLALFQNEDERREAGKRGSALIKQHQGVLDRLLGKISVCDN